MGLGEVVLAQLSRFLRTQGQLPAVYMSGKRLADTTGSWLAEMAPHSVKNAMKRLLSDIAERKRDEVAGTDLAASVDIQVRNSGAASECLR